jgi:hypothetical protein
MKKIKIVVKDNAKVIDKLDVWKKWYDGAKHFFTVKLLPPHL